MRRVQHFLKKSYNTRWMKNNPDALAVTKSDLLGSLWRDTISTVNDNGSGIVLMLKGDMIGVIVPESLLREFYNNINNPEESDAVTYVTKSELKNNFEACANRLSLGENLIVLDENEEPLFGVACREFSTFIKINQKNIVIFKEHVFDDSDSTHQDPLSDLSY